ncbi:MAG: HigA family addiction module antitoxin [Burkholderiaceae bacterium]|nr:HigA family addiction module antitoxin [Burkholderiaceae bacterium]MCD8517961.1 HigA family addiction module antitoxin [Burkholderiaceae bacterium]MCD8536392.1 HigA family addiction module antitoxin [Burkholderiaceae bacterium]MCD8564881.1 HigA family addiction module antitoxin [Burkholderiaceae bacterium]
MQMHNPPHPGSILREDVLPELGITVTEAASQLGVSRVQLSRFIHEHAAVTPEFAMRLAKWLGAPTARTWLQMQLEYDLWQLAKKKPRLDVTPVRAPRSAMPAGSARH